MFPVKVWEFLAVVLRQFYKSTETFLSQNFFDEFYEINAFSRFWPMLQSRNSILRATRKTILGKRFLSFISKKNNFHRFLW